MSKTVRIRRIAPPLNVLCSLYAKSGIKLNTDTGVVGDIYCPLIQNYDAVAQTYLSDRTVIPSVIVPKIKLSASDGSVSYDNTSTQLTNLKWFIQREDDAVGHDITTYDADTGRSEWTGKYTIAGSGAERGAITITKNIPSGFYYTIWFEAYFDDERTGITNSIHIVTERLQLYTNVNAESSYSMSLDRPSGEIYNELLDKRIEYDYRSARGLLSQGEVFQDDGNTYLRRVNIRLRRGSVNLTVNTDFTIKIERLENDGSYTIVTVSDNDIESITDNVIIFNLSYFDSCTWKISCMKGNRVLQYQYVGFTRSKDVPDLDIISASTFASNSGVNMAKAQLTYQNKVMAYPEAYCDIAWSRKSQNGSLMDAGGGENLSIDLSDPAILPSSDNDLTLSVDVTKRGKVSVLTDTDSTLLTDENGNQLTIN